MFSEAYACHLAVVNSQMKPDMTRLSKSTSPAKTLDSHLPAAIEIRQRPLISDTMSCLTCVHSPIRKDAASYWVFTMDWDNPRSSLYAGIMSGNLDEVRSAINAGANVNGRYRDVSPLHLAAMFNSSDIVSFLIESGANINDVSSDKDRRSPLHFAAYYGSNDAVKVLLHFGARSDQADSYGFTPGELALQRNETSTAQSIARSVPAETNTHTLREHNRNRQGSSLPDH